jgi:lipopolysaccharide transport system permease protein
MQNFSATPREMLASLWRHRGLIQASAKREVLGRYRGSVLGLLWSFFNPLLMLLVYTFVFSVVFKSRWSGGSESKTEFALVLFVGLIVFNLFSECINRAPTLILSNANYVKKVVFPLEILPFVGLISALYHALISMVVWVVAYILFFGLPQPTALLLPLIVVPLCLLVMGLSWALASLGVFLRDVAQFIGVLTTVLMFLSPVFYPASGIPESYRHWLYLNPVTPVIELSRDVLYWGKLPDFGLLGIYWLVTAIIAWLGFAWFQKTRKGFADVL